MMIFLSEFATFFNSCVHLYDSDEETLEELASSEEAQSLFEKAEDAVTGLLSCGRVHLSVAVEHREKFEVAVGNGDDDFEGDPEWAKRLNIAKEKFDQAFEMEPESYHVLLCLGEHQYEMVFLNYSMHINNSNAEQLGLLNIAEANLESAFRIWKTKTKLGIQSIDDLKNSTSNTKEEVSKIRKRHEDACDILGTWAGILYDKSELEFSDCKDWKRTLYLAIKKHQLLGLSNTQISQLRKDHFSQVNVMFSRVHLFCVNYCYLLI